MFSVSAASLLVRVTPSHLRGRAQGVWAGAFLIGLVAGPAVGTVATFSLRLPFFLYAGTLVVAGLLGLGALRHSELAARQSDRSEPLALRRRAAQPRLPRRPRRGVRRRLRAGRRPVGDGAALRHATRSTCRPAGPTRRSSSSAWSAAPCCCRPGKVADTVGRRPGDRGRPARRRAGVRAAPGAAGDRRPGDRDGADRRGGGVRLGGPGRGDGRRRGRQGRHRGRGLPDGRRPRLGPRPGRDRAGWPTRPATRPAFVLCAAVCVLPVFAVLAAPETLQHRATSRPAVEDAARDARQRRAADGSPTGGSTWLR